MSKYYVLLTGGKNNAGDFLIKQRAKDLLTELRPDRRFIDLDGWKPLTDEQLEKVNGSEALLLTGGPALTNRMKPVVYSLRDQLGDIHVPITTYGVGWSSPDGRLSRTHGYPFNSESKGVLHRIANDGLPASVRDYHSQALLINSGVKEAVMTACPATYSTPHINSELRATNAIRRITFSAGVHMAKSRRLKRQALQLIEATRAAFPDAELTVAFHHALGSTYQKAYGRATSVFKEQRRLAAWLESEGIPYIDLSGSHEDFIDHYSGIDLHVGYRVHAHILMTSLRRPSALIAEDGRGSALKDVLGGHIYDAFERFSDVRSLYEFYSSNLALRALRKYLPLDAYITNEGLPQDMIRALLNDQAAGWPKAQQAVAASKAHWPTMRNFLAALP